MDIYQKEIIYIIRILIAGICGMVIGFERKNRLKEAGIRTHCLVACGVALMMILSKYSFFDIGIDSVGLKSADPARIAAQVVSGVGFLGAGMIFVHKNTITGLTTAAGIWITAGIGMAMGAGMYLTGAVAALIVVVVQTVLHMNMRWIKTPDIKIINIYEVDKPEYQNDLTKRFKEHGITVHDVSIKKKGNSGAKNYKMHVEIPCFVTEDEIMSLIEYDCEIKVNA